MLATVLIAALALPDDLADLRAAFEAAQQPEARIAVLDQLAEFYEPHEPDAAGVTQVVIDALGGESYAVRAHASALLGTRFDHDAAVEALVPQAPQQVTMSDDVLERLLAFGTAGAFQGALGVMATYEELVESGADELEHERTRALGPKPSPRMTDAQWATQDAAMRKRSIERLEARQAYSADWGVTYHKRLEAFAQQHKLPDAPAGLASKEWSAWYARHAPKLPQSLNNARKK